MEESRIIGHRDDASFADMSEALFQATLTGNEMEIMNLQRAMRERFGDVL